MRCRVYARVLHDLYDRTLEMEDLGRAMYSAIKFNMTVGTKGEGIIRRRRLNDHKNGTIMILEK